MRGHNDRGGGCRRGVTLVLPDIVWLFVCRVCLLRDSVYVFCVRIYVCVHVRVFVCNLPL